LKVPCGRATFPGKMENSFMSKKPLITYHELRKNSPSKPRELGRKVLERNSFNVSLESRIFDVSRQMMRIVL